MNRRPGYEIVLNALKVGKEVEVGGVLLAMSADDQICRCVTMTDTQTGEKKEMLYVLDAPINWFIKHCELISDTDLFIMAAETALMVEAQKSAEKRRKHMESIARTRQSEEEMPQSPEC